MGQTIDTNINAINAYTSDINMPKQSQPEKAVAISADYKYEYVAEKKNDIKVNNTMDNFDDYLKNKEKKEKEASIDERSREEKAKDDAKEIRTHLSSEEIKRLKMMGIDVSGATLSDLMSMVNTMRANEHSEEMAEMLAEISASNGNMSNMTIIGGQIKIGGTNFKISNNELTYLVRNEMNITTENMYKAHFSGSVAAEQKIDDSLFENMKKQMSSIVEMAGYKDDENALEGAKFMLANELPVTTDSIKTYMDFQKIVGQDISATQLPYDDADYITMKSEELYMEIHSWDYSSIEAAVNEVMADDGKVISNINVDDSKSALTKEAANINTNLSLASIAKSKNIGEIKNITAMRQLQEIRFSMTLQVAKRMVSLDVNIDTRELSKTVDILKKAEQSIAKEELKDAGVEITAENLDLLGDLKSKVEDIRQAHAGILATPLRGEELTLNNLHANISEEKYSSYSFEAVVRSYEAVGTAPRADMGDSISKAFRNVDDMLNEMSIEINYESQRAVRILGYNSMDITAENIESVIGYDRQVNQLMDSFYPEAVMGIIKDGINPLDLPIDELNQIIKDRNYNAGVSEAKNFASYLRRLEDMGDVTAEERESYIGIYRAMDKLAKSGDREAGWLFANGARLTVRNLISAARSRKAKGIDASINDDFGMLDKLNMKGKSITDQIEAAFNMNDMDEYEQFRRLNPNVEQFILENNIEYTMDNAFAVNAMINTPGGIYDMVSEVMSKLKFSDHSKEDLIDEETENMSDSLAGEEVGLDILEELSTDKILNDINETGELSLRYENIRDMVTNMMYEQATLGNLSSMDLSAIRTINAGFNVMRNMASEDKYQVPIETTSGTKLMNLTIISGADAGNIRISITGEKMGRITASINVSEENAVWGYIASETSDGNFALAAKGEEIKALLGEAGIDSSEVEIGKLKPGAKTPVKNNETVKQSKAQLYKISVSFVKTISNILE